MANDIYSDAVEQLPAAAVTPPAPDQTPNPYGGVIDTMDAQGQQALRTSFVQADKTTPDRAADVQRLSTKTGVAPDIIERNFDAIQRRAILDDTPYAQMQRETPAVATWASEPQNAAVAKDDMASLGALEWLLKAPSRALAQGIDSTRYALLRAESITRDLSQTEQDQLNAYKFGMDNGGQLGAGSSWFRGAVTGLMKNLPMLFGAGIAANRYGMAGAAEVGAAGALAGSVLPGAGTAAGFMAGAGTGYAAGALYGGFKFGAQLAAGQAYDEFSSFKDELGRPLDPQVAKTAALATGLINGALMTGGFHVLAESIPGLDKLGGVLTTSAVKQALLQPTVRAGLLEAAKTFGGTLTFETANMVAQRAAQILVGDVAKESSGQPFTIRDAGETAADLGQTAAGALRDFALLTAAGPAAGFAIDRLRAQDALHNATFFHALGEGVAQSKTAQRLPEALQTVLAAATKDGPVETVYAPIESWSTYWQSKGVDPAEIATKVTGDPQAFDRATRTGEDLAIPTAKYATTLAATEHNAFFANELRLAPEQMNAREAQAFEQTIREQEARHEEVAAAQPAAPVRESITQQLEAAGVERSTAESYATLYEHAFQTLGERAGVDPVELFNRYGLTIERPELVDKAAEPAQNSEGFFNVKRDVEPEAARETPAVEEGPGLSDGAVEQPHVDQGGRDETGSARDGAEPRGLPTPGLPDVDELFREPEPDHTAGRLTPGVRAALAWIADELHTFTKTDDTWNYVGDEHGWHGNAGGGKYDLVKGMGGTPVYHDILAFSPVNKVNSGRNKGKPARKAHGERADVLEAVRQLIETGKVSNNLQEGALRVAENRLADNYEHLSRPWLPRPDAIVAPKEFTDALATAIDAAEESDSIDTGEGDASFDPTQYDQQPRPEFVPVGGEADENADRQKLIADETTARNDIAQAGETDAQKAALRDATQGGKVRVLYQPAPGDLFGSEEAAADTLDTGEQQPRLPGDAGAVREQNVQTPEFDAPFSLTSEVATGSKGKQSTLFQPFFHGSPHDFDQFSSKYIGTGEGAQAYGYGLYFAENPNVAENYRKQTTDGAARFVENGVGIDEDSARRKIADAVFTGPGDYSRGEAHSAARTVVALLLDGETHDEIASRYRDQPGDEAKLAALEAARRYAVEKPSGKLYQVDIPDEHVARMLDWDKPLSEQPENVKQALERLDVPMRERWKESGAWEHVTGRTLYENVVDGTDAAARGSMAYKARQQAASRALNEAGVPGIKYLDNGSRGPRAPFAGDSALLHAAESVKTSGLSPDEALASLASAYPNQPATDREAAINEAYDIAPKQTRNVVVFDDSIVTLTHKDGSPVTAKERKEFFQGEDSEKKRGYIRIGADRTLTIGMLQHADLSTFLHESAHGFFEVMRDLAKEPGADSIRADLATLDAWLADEDHTGAGYSVKQHEQFARGFEAYLMEGKAPSAELRGVFARFRTWLVGVYRSLKGLNVELTPEVRGVFDRLLASDQAIDQAQAEGHIEPLFTDAAMAGMTPEAFDAYRATVAEASQRAKDELQAKLMRDYTREQNAYVNGERDAIRATVAGEVHQEPIYQAMAAIRKGTRPDGSALVEGEAAAPMKLAKADLVDRYTPDEMKTLRDRQLYAAKDGTPADVVAELFGFPSGDALVRALLAAPTMKDRIEGETSARLKAKLGDVILDGRLADQAQQAVYGEGRQQVVHAELKALTAGMVKGTIPPASVINGLAERRIADTRVRDVRPGQFLMAARRASQRAFELLSTHQDRAGAVQAKQQELMNLALYREASKAQEAVDSAVSYLRSFDTSTKRERLAKAGGDYLQQIDGLRERFDLTRRTLKEIDRRTALKDFIDAQQAKGLELAIPLDLQNEVRRQNYRDGTVDELRGIRDAVQSIDHIARLKDRLLRAQAQRELSTLAADGATSIETNSNGPRKPEMEPRLPGAKGKRDVRGWLIAHRPIQALFRQMDGFKDGFMFENLWRPAHEARNAEGTMGREAAAELKRIHTDRFRGEESTLYAPLFVPALNQELSLAARLAVAFNSGNEGNRERLRGGGIGNTGPLTDEKIQAILNTLSDRDWRYVRETTALINSYRDQIGTLYKRVTGVEPTWVEPSAFHTAHGEMPGWYYPISYEGRASAAALPGPEASFTDILAKSSYMRFTTANGHTEARVAHTGIPLRADLGVIGEHLQQVIHDLTHREMLVDAGRLLGRKEMQDAIYRHYGDQYYNEIKGAFRDLAVGTMPAPSWYRMIEPVRRRASMARLAWNFATMVRHVTNITSGMVRVGDTDVLKAIPKWLGSAKDAEFSAGWVSDNSPLMAHRWNHRLEELASINNDIGLNRGKWASTMRDAAVSVGVNPDLTKRMSDSYLYGIHKIIQMAEIPTWIAAYQKAVEGGGEHPRAIASADAAILDAFGGGDLLDQAGVQRSYGGKLFSTFMTYGLSLHRQNYEIFSKDQSVGRKVVDATLLNIAPVLFLGAIFHQATGKGTYTQEVAEELFAHLLGMGVFTRELASALRSPDYAGPPSLSMFGTATRLIFHAKEAILNEESGQTTKAQRAAKTSAELAGQFYGVPVYQIEKTAAGIQALSEGKTTNPSAVLFGPAKKGN